VDNSLNVVLEAEDIFIPKGFFLVSLKLLVGHQLCRHTSEKFLGLFSPEQGRLGGGLMSAVAPHRDQRGSAELCSPRQRQGPRERHGAVSGEGQLWARDRLCTRVRGAWRRLPRAVGIAASAGVQGASG